MKPIQSWAVDLEDEASKQLQNLASLPFIHNHVAVMADAHAGKGSTVGAVIATRGAIIPAAVGVDIGCGMSAVPLFVPIETLGTGEQLRELRGRIEKRVPVGFSMHTTVQEKAASYGWWAEAQPWSDQKVLSRLTRQMGSLGGGNHFIEICRDEGGSAWVMLHSGSRFVGKHVADYHINSAKGLMKQYFVQLPDPDLAYLAEETPEFDAYIRDMQMAQQYASDNRSHMLQAVLDEVTQHMLSLHGEKRRSEWAMRFAHGEQIHCHHNYTTREHHYGANVWVTRKGAVCAREGVKGIIPGSMGTRSYIVEGLGKPESFNSCSHGAGRRMSRTKARKQFTMKDFAAAVDGVECSHRESVLDEHPQAYKDIDAVMAAQTELVRPLHTLKQILCVKG